MASTNSTKITATGNADNTTATKSTKIEPGTVVPDIDWFELAKILNIKSVQNKTLYKISMAGGNIINASKDHNLPTGHTCGIHTNPDEAPFIIWTSGEKEYI